MDDDQDYLKARRRVKAIKGFYLHVSIFVLVVAFLFLVNVMTRAHGGCNGCSSVGE
jgi:hypothetical protein